jgi:hypothetical protein
MLSETGFCLCTVNDLQKLFLAGRPLHRNFEIFRRQFELLKSGSGTLVSICVVRSGLKEAGAKLVGVSS